MSTTTVVEAKQRFRISSVLGNIFKRDSRAGLVWISVWQTDHSLEPNFQDILQQFFVSRAVNSDGVGTVFHLRNDAPNTKRPHAILARLDDLSHISSSTELTSFLPKQGQMGDCGLGCDLRAYRLIQRYEGKRGRSGRAKCVVSVLIEPADGQTTDVDQWYRNEYLPSLRDTPMFVRSTRYESIPDAANVDSSPSPSLLALHEFTTVQALLDFAIRHGDIVPETSWANRIFAQVKSVERNIWEVESKYSPRDAKTASL